LLVHAGKDTTEGRASPSPECMTRSRECGIRLRGKRSVAVDDTTGKPERDAED
jgi:hypothetical protein